MSEQPQSLESQLKMARPRKTEVARIPLTPEEDKRLFRILNKAIEAEKKRELAKAIELYEQYKEELLQIKREKMPWDMERLIEWAKKDAGIANAERWVTANFEYDEEGKLIAINDIDLTGKELKELPSGVSFIGDLRLTKAKVQKFPTEFSVDGNLYLDEARVKRLPPGLDVGNHLTLKKSQVELLGENTIVDGWLDVTESKLQCLPENLTVISRLYASGLKSIKGIPKSLRVEGDLNLQGTNIRKIPDDFRVGNRLVLMNTPILEIGNNVNIGGSLVLTGTKIQRIGNNLRVGKDLVLGRCSKLKSLPRNIEVGGKVDIHDTRIGSIPPMHVKGDLNISSNYRISNLPDNLQVDGNINVGLCKKKLYEKAKKLKEQGKIKGEIKGQIDPRHKT